MDKVSKEQRSYNMSRITSTNTLPEIKVRKFLYSLGYRYRVNVKDLPGKPDIVFRPQKKIINVNGCFWHMHNCKDGSYVPKTNSEFWIDKLNKNKSRDEKNKKKLISESWNVIDIWECEVSSGEYEKILIDYLN